MRDEIIYKKICQVSSLLDEIDEMINTQPTELQKVDWEISDWLHYIENNEVSDANSIKIINKIKELRKIRRTLNNERAIEDTYKNNASKMMGNNSRQFLLQEVNKTMKQLNCEYKNRVLTEESINNILAGGKKRGRPKKEAQNEQEAEVSL